MFPLMGNMAPFKEADFPAKAGNYSRGSVLFL